MVDPSSVTDADRGARPATFARSCSLGYSIWRLPTIEELLGIYDPSISVRMPFDSTVTFKVQEKGDVSTHFDVTGSLTRRRGFSISKMMGCAVCVIVMAPIGAGLRASAQRAPTEPAFAVATVKPVDPSYRFDGKRFWAHVNPAGASYWYMSIDNLVTYDFGVEPFQVTGPEWAEHDHFDIEARFPEGADPKDEKRMLQTLLKDRFRLAFHVEKRELESYALVVGKHGQKLTPSLPDPAIPEADAALKTGDNNAAEGPAKSNAVRNPDGSSTIDMGKRGTQTIRFDQEHWSNRFELSKMTMGDLAGRLIGCLGGGMHHVEDETGIEGNYQVAYDCPLPTRPTAMSPGDAAGSLPSDPQTGSTLTRSLDAMGLKLEKRKVLRNVYVIDHVEKPSEN